MGLLPVFGVLQAFSFDTKNLADDILGDDDLSALPVTDDSSSNDLSIVPEQCVRVMVPGTMEA